MASKELFSHLSLWRKNLFLKSLRFCLYFILYIHVWIRILSRIQKAPEYGTDPDPHHCLSTLKIFILLLTIFRGKYLKLSTCWQKSNRRQRRTYSRAGESYLVTILFSKQVTACVGQAAVPQPAAAGQAEAAGPGPQQQSDQHHGA